MGIVSNAGVEILQIALDGTRTPCFRDDTYTEYDDPRFPRYPPLPIRTCSGYRHPVNQ